MVLKSNTSEEEEEENMIQEALSSDTYEGAGRESESIAKQIEQFNKSIKEEKMLERLEKLMNEAGVVLEADSKLLECLKKKDYLKLLAEMIGRPHQYQSATTVLS